jgi:hypothetical protein
MSAAFDIRERPVLECPICRQSYDDRFQVFVPPHYEAFDTVACARRAAEVWGWDNTAPVPVILPTIEYVQARSETQVASVVRRRRVAALAGFDLASGQAALAAGVGLLAAGTAASIYLWARPGGVTTPSSPIAAGAPTTGETIVPPAVRATPLTTASPRTRPAAHAVSRPQFVAFTGTGRSVGSGTRAGTVLAKTSSGAPLSTSPESHAGSPTQVQKPPPRTPKAPPVTPKPPTSSSPAPTPQANPAGPAEPTLSGPGSISPAGSPPPQAPPAQTPPPQPPPEKPPPQPPPPPEKPPPQPPPPPTPPPSTPPPQTTPDQSGPGGDDDHGQPGGTRPGNGWGDRNHDHTGPPGQGNNGNGGGNGNGHGHGR